MITLPELRGFWGYALFALINTGVLWTLFWLRASDRVGWADAGLAFVLAVLIVLGIIFARRKAPWIKEPTWRADFIAALVAFTLTFGAMYADAYLLHRRDITARRFRDDVVFFAILSIADMVCSSLRRAHARRQVL